MTKYPAPALAQGMEILEKVTECESAAFGQLQRALNTNANTLNRCLVTLCALGYIEKQADGRYAVGMKLRLLSAGRSVFDRLRENARPIMQAFTQEYGATSILHSVRGESMKVLDKTTVSTSISMHEVGLDLAANDEHLLTPWAIVRMFAQGRSEEEALASFDASPYGALLSCSREEWLEAYRETKICGYCSDESRIMDSIERHAFPVYAGDANLIGVIGWGVYPGSLAQSRREEMIGRMRRDAIALSQTMRAICQTRFME